MYQLILQYPKGIHSIYLKGKLLRYHLRLQSKEVNCTMYQLIPPYPKGILGIYLSVNLNVYSKDAMHLIAGGVAQLQAAMLKQMSTDKTGERTPETVKPGTTVLPSLPPVRSESASVDLLDWMELIEAPMCDLSDGSAAWWKQVRSKAAFAYDKWVVSGPMERLSITPEGTNDLEEGRWSRVNSRAASMVLTALDESIRSELVSRRMTGSVTAIVFRLLTLYQPGGEEEKYRTLQQLQSPPRETDPAKAVESLRAWNRWLRRCQELNIQAPDPSLQVRALNSVVKGVLEKNSEACFRTNLVRSNLKIDSNPTKESVEKLYKHLMGECESLATVTTSVATATTPSSTRPEPKLKPVKTETSVTTSTPQPPTPRSPSQNTSASGDDEKDKRGVTPCKFFGKTYKGCARLQKCPFLHTWEGLEREKPTRCLACGGKHMVKECPHKKPHGTSSNPAGASSTSTAASSTAKAPPTTPRNTASTSTTATAASKTVRIDDTPEVEHVPARGSGAATSDTLDLKEVLADVGKVLKAMSTTTLKKFTVEEATTEGQQRGLMETKDEIPHKVTKSAVMGQSENEESTGLLDSGASHPMRPAKLSEYQKGQPVKVTLAGEDVKLLMQNDHGTILVQEEQAVILPIVPLGAVIQELGYTLNWSPKVLRLTHPFKKSIKVKIRNHCPEVAACDALGLIRDLECAQVNALNERVASLKARLEVIKKEEKRDWLELLQEFAATGTKTLLLKAILTSPITKDLPAEVQTKLLQDFDRDGGESYLKALPLSRRKRRALVASRSWVVYLFSGVDRYKNDPFDAIPTAGKVVLEIDKDASKLWDLNRKDGVYQLLLWAACTGRIADIISSPPHSSWPTSQTPKYGPEAYAMRSSDEPYGIKDLAVFQRQRVDEETAHVAKQLVVWMLAQMCGKRNVGFLLETPATQQRLSERRDEGVSVWSTEMWKNFGSISGIKEFSFYKGAFGHRARCPTTIATTYPSVNQIDYNQGVPDDSVPATLLSDQELRRWPRNFKEFVAEAIKDYRTGSWKEEEEMIRAGVRVNKLTKVKGRDMDHDDYKYIMVAAYRCPREYMSEKAAAELDKDFYVPDEASEHEDDDLLEVVGGGEEAGDVEGSGFSEDEKEEVPLGPETMDEAVEGLAQQEEILLQLRQSGLHVGGVHTDRAREFKAKAFKDGGLTVAKSVKFGVFEPNKDFKGILSPAVAEGLPEEEEIVEEPPTRVELREEIEFRARKLLEEENFSLEEVVNLYKLLELRGDSDTRLGKKTKITSWYTGAFVHGGVAGVRANLKEFPHTTTYLVKVAKHFCGEVNFSALGIAKNAQLGLHRDSHNYSLSKNYVIPLVDVEGGSLWVQDDDVEEASAVHKAFANGKVVRGKCIEFKKGSPMEFSPRRWHEVQPWVGERLVLLMYTPRATKLSNESVEALKEVGFGVDPQSLVHSEENPPDDDEHREPPRDSPTAAIKMLHVCPDPEEEACAFVEIEENEAFQGSGSNTPARHLQQAFQKEPLEVTLRKAIKKAEVQYTAGIEDLLNDLKKDGKPLEVTHNVSLQDVRKNIGAWKQSALKEFTNLTEVKQAFRVVKRNELPSNCRIVPCKGVYTVKPDKSELGYRRKTRFVACGNHVPEGEGDFDLFATGVDATSLRTMLAVNARKPWRTGTTDVRQAFVLAKWRGDPVAMEPPGIALELGLATPGDMWYVEQAIYGLRESPALWSQFRDEQMRMARWTMEVEGENVTMMIEQMITDNQIWKIVREDQPQGEVYGHIMVYIDDLLIHAAEQAMHGFFQWVSKKWEVDALDILDYDHPIRFLGMELHRVKNGIELSQEGFIGEVLRAHHHKGGRSHSQGPKETLLLTDEEEQALIQAEPTQRDPKDPAVKEAQRRVGELLWLMGRTRPDIQHTESIMAARLLRCPEMVNKIGERLLDYLNETKHYRLAFTQDEEDVVRGLDIFTDSSFAPSGGRSQGAAAVFYGNNPLVWRSGRQQLTTLSTAESELVESVEGTLLGLSTRGKITRNELKELQCLLQLDPDSLSVTEKVIADAVQMANDGHTWQQIQHRAVHQAAKSDEVFTINAVHAVPTLSKGGQSLSHLSTELVHFLAWLGHRELCFKSDGEPAQVYEVWIAQVEPSMDMKNWSYLVLFLAALAFLAFMVPSGTSGCKHPSDSCFGCLDGANILEGNDFYTAQEIQWSLKVHLEEIEYDKGH
ncbi:RE1, partial [Symbiodinium sp. KB8]